MIHTCDLLPRSALQVISAWSSAAKEEAEQQLLWDMQQTPGAVAQHARSLLRMAVHFWKSAHVICLRERLAETRRQQTWQQVGSWLGELQQRDVSSSPNQQHDKIAAGPGDPEDNSWLEELQQGTGNALTNVCEEDAHGIDDIRPGNQGQRDANSMIHQSMSSKAGTHLDEPVKAVVQDGTWLDNAIQPSSPYADQWEATAGNQTSTKWLRRDMERDEAQQQKPVSCTAQASMKQSQSWSMAQTADSALISTHGSKLLHEQRAQPSIVGEEEEWLADLLIPGSNV